MNQEQRRLKLINITENKWRAFIELSSYNPQNNEDDGVFYFDITRKPLMTAAKDGSTFLKFQEGMICVRESVKDILEAIDRLIEAEQEKKAKEAREYMEATAARVAQTEKMLAGK